MSDFAITVVGMNEIERRNARRMVKLKGGAGGQGINRKANAQAVAIVDGWVQKNFSTDGRMAMGGKGWAPLAKKTMRARQEGWGGYVKRSNPQILRDQGKLKTQWKHYFTSTIGLLRSAVEYGLYHDDPSPKSHLPKRRILPRQDQIKAKIKAHYRWFLRNGIK